MLYIVLSAFYALICLIIYEIGAIIYDDESLMEWVFPLPSWEVAKLEFMVKFIWFQTCALFLFFKVILSIK